MLSILKTNNENEFHKKRIFFEKPYLFKYKKITVPEEFFFVSYVSE